MTRCCLQLTSEQANTEIDPTATAAAAGGATALGGAGGKDAKGGAKDAKGGDKKAAGGKGSPGKGGRKGGKKDEGPVESTSCYSELKIN